MEGLATLKTPFRPHGRVTAGTSSPLTDGATVSLLAGGPAVQELGLTPKMRLVSFAFAGVEPEIMGLGPIPSTEKARRQAGTIGRAPCRERGCRYYYGLGVPDVLKKKN